MKRRDIKISRGEFQKIAEKDRATIVNIRNRLCNYDDRFFEDRIHGELSIIEDLVQNLKLKKFDLLYSVKLDLSVVLRRMKSWDNREEFKDDYISFYNIYKFVSMLYEAKEIKNDYRALVESLGNIDCLRKLLEINENKLLENNIGNEIYDIKFRHSNVKDINIALLLYENALLGGLCNGTFSIYRRRRQERNKISKIDL